MLVHTSGHLLSTMSEDSGCGKDNAAFVACDLSFRTLKDWEGEELDDLSFKKGDVISATKRDGAGWAFGSLPDGASGWFPLDCTEETHTRAVADIGTNTGHVSVPLYSLSLTLILPVRIGGFHQRGQGQTSAFKLGPSHQHLSLEPSGPT